MKQEILNDGFTQFMADVLAAGIVKDNLEDVDRTDLIKLFPIYFDEAMQNKLTLQIDEESDKQLGSWLGDKFKKLTNFTKATLKNPSKSLYIPLRETIKVVSPSVAKKFGAAAEKNPLNKITDAGNTYLFKNPQVAFAIAAVIPGLNVVAIIVAAGLAIAQTEYGKLNQRKIDELNKKYQERAIIAAESGQQIEQPPIYFDGNPQELLAKIHTPQFLEAATQECKKALIEKMGYPDNAATLLMAKNAAATSVKDLDTKIKNGEIQKIPSDLVAGNVGLTNDSSGLTKLLPFAVAAYTLLN